MLWPYLFPLYASHIFKASLLRYGVLEIMRNFILTRGRYISEGYFYFLSYYSRAYEKLFSDDPARLQFITSLKNVPKDQLHRKRIVKDIYIFFLQGKIQSVSENAISPPCTVQFCITYTVEQSLGVILFYLPLQKG